MSVYLGTTYLAGASTSTHTIMNANNLLDFKWSDHELNDQSWLRADTFSWQDGTVYSDAYNHLTFDYSGGTSQTETIGSHTITFVEASDGHRITTDESTVADIYSESGVAWFYVLDTANQRFKLPRINPTCEELIQIVRAKGNGIGIAYTDGTNDSTINLATSGNAGSVFMMAMADVGSAVGTSTSRRTNTLSTTVLGITTDSSKSGIISDMTESTSVFKGHLYLYFYVGQFSQSATEQTAGLNSSLFNGKADTDLNNVSAGIDFVVESYQNGTEWYRLYKSGWVEQGGRISGGTSTSIINYSVTFLKEFSNTNYNITTLSLQRNSASSPSSFHVSTRTTAGFSGGFIGAMPDGIDWEAKGMSA